MKAAMTHVLNKKNTKSKTIRKESLKVYAQKQIVESRTKQSNIKEVDR